MEKLQQKGCDVLFMTDEVDGFVPQTLVKYQDKELKAITAGDLGLETEEEKKAAEEKSEKSKQTLEFVKKTLGDKIKDCLLYTSRPVLPHRYARPDAPETAWPQTEAAVPRRSAAAYS